MDWRVATWKGAVSLVEGAAALVISLGVLIRKRPTGTARENHWTWSWGHLQADGRVAWQESYSADHFLSFRDAVAAAVVETATTDRREA